MTSRARWAALALVLTAPPEPRVPGEVPFLEAPYHLAARPAGAGPVAWRAVSPAVR